MPNPYLFAVILTFIAYIMGWMLTKNGPMDMIVHWYSGFWKYLTFGMQMVLILVTGHALAIAPGVHPALKRLARIPKTSGQAVLLTAYVATIITYFHWGLGLIVAAIFAREVAKEGYAKKINIHYPLIAATAYTGQMVWHVGPSTSAGLLSATKGHVFEKIFGVIPITESVFTPYAILMAIMLCLFVIPITMWLMTPKDPDECMGIDACIGIDKFAAELAEDKDLDKDEKPSPLTKKGFADLLENSSIISYLVGLAGVVYIVYYFATKGVSLNLNIFNFIFLIAGIILHRTPIRYVRAISTATPGASGIILQFPFYAGIMGMISYSGLAVIITTWFLGFATAATFPIIAWLTGGIVNIFIPSGGGEWGVIGGIVGQVSVNLGVPVGKTIVAFGCGDMWTNMFQPFWAIALLGITGLRARDIMGYCMMLMIVAAPFIAFGLYFFPY
ncbi:MAG: short-chain fatty acid transporter [Desulfobacterales bacterium]|nr:short-chain fatty acid transporter [Desulfobacterales bacterium]